LLYELLFDEVVCALQPSHVDMNTAVWTANYAALERYMCDQVIVNAVTNRVGKVNTTVL